MPEIELKMDHRPQWGAMIEMPTEKPMDEIIRALQERAKELSCLYQVDEILNQKDVEQDAALQQTDRSHPGGLAVPTALRRRSGARESPVRADGIQRDTLGDDGADHHSTERESVS